MAFNDASDQLEPIRKMVSFNLVEDPRILSEAVARSVRELYSRAEGEELRILGWRAEFGRAPGSRFGEGIMTVTATETARKSRRLTAAQMDTEIMGLLSFRRED